MEYIKTCIDGVWIIEPKVFNDARGYFFEAWKKDEFEEHVGKVSFVQDNESKSCYGVLRGLHYQEEPHAQAKLVSCLHGSIFNVAVDIRPDSPTFGQYVSEILSAENQKVMYIPKGFAHGYLTLEPNTLMQWCVDADFCAEAAKCLRWDSCGIDWPGKIEEFIISDKDKNGTRFKKVYFCD